MLDREYDIGPELLDYIKKRLEFGKAKYGHGIILDDDISKYDSEWHKETLHINNWNAMCLEEMLDGMVYASACILTSDKGDKYGEVLKHCMAAAKLLIE